MVPNANSNRYTKLACRIKKFGDGIEVGGFKSHEFDDVENVGERPARPACTFGGSSIESGRQADLVSSPAPEPYGFLV